MLGDSYDYGISWAVVSYIVAGYEVVDSENMATLINEHTSYLLDFTRPVMEDIFVSEKDCAVSKEAALLFCKYIDNEYGFDKLIELSKMEVGNSEKTELKNEWLKSIGVSEDYSPAAPYFFACNEGADKDEYPYYIQSESYDLYIATADIKNDDYRGFFWYYLQTSECWEADLKDAREVYFGFDREVPRVNMYTCFTKDGGFALAEYDYYNNKISFYDSFGSAIMTFVHEYIHHLEKEDHWKSKLNQVFYVRAMNEGYAELNNWYYCERKASCLYMEPSKEALYALWDEDNNRFDFGLINDMVAYVQATQIGKKYISVIYTEEISDGEIKPYKYLSYHELASLLHYLEGVKGEEVVRAAFMDENKFEELFDGDYEGTYKKWLGYLEEKKNNNTEAYENILSINM